MQIKPKKNKNHYKKSLATVPFPNCKNLKPTTLLALLRKLYVA